VVAGGLTRRRRQDGEPELLATLADLPPQDLGVIRSRDGTGIAIRAAGPETAPVLVFAHGLSLDLTMWRAQWAALSPEFRCVLYDQRGHGRSDLAAGGDYSPRALGEDLEAVLEAAVVDGRCVVVGHSMGGVGILALAESRPELFGTRVGGVVLADTAAAEIVRGAIGAIGARLEGLVRTGLRSALSRAGRADRIRRLLAAGRADLATALTRVTNFGPNPDPALVRYVTALATAAPVEVWMDGLAGLVEMDLRHAVEVVDVPALVVVGDLDRITPPSTASALARALPEGELEVIHGAGHLPMMERPGKFNRLLQTFAGRVLAPAADEPARSAGASP
jgi:pimeloyl-ACP methyl ester carboxylesterase